MINGLFAAVVARTIYYIHVYRVYVKKLKDLTYSSFHHCSPIQVISMNLKQTFSPLQFFVQFTVTCVLVDNGDQAVKNNTTASQSAEGPPPTSTRSRVS